jgi:hypothetical protein
MESAKDTISDSDLGATAIHTIAFNMGDANYLTPGEFIDIDFGSFTGAVEGNVVCPTDTSASTTPNGVGCVVDAGGFLESTSTQTITVSSVISPGSAGDYTVIIGSFDASYVEIESTDMKVYIIDDVSVTASVDAKLEFTIYGLATSTLVNGELTTGSSTPDELSFGTLDTTAGASSTLGHELKVSTNATGGFTVTVQQDHELENGAGANINSFQDSETGTGSTTPPLQSWSSPGGTIGYTNEYGHMGLTSEDSNLSWGGGDPFGDTLYAGLNDTDTLEVMYNNGPANGTGDGVGVAQVAYKIEITTLQEAGDYSNTLTYICTPTF